MTRVDPPRELDSAEVLKFAVVSTEVATRATRHVVGGDPVGPAAALAIARYPGEDTTYLLYLDENGNVITDTWHASLEDALCHASFEYEGLHWREVTEL
jgi:hypothetical protein